MKKENQQLLKSKKIEYTFKKMNSPESNFGTTDTNLTTTSGATTIVTINLTTSQLCTR